MMNILLNRIGPYYKNTIGNHQAEFRRGGSTQDQIFILKKVLEKSWKVAQELHGGQKRSLEDHDWTSNNQEIGEIDKGEYEWY